MGKEDFSKTGLRLKYDPESRIPQIPYAEDVLYAMHLSDKDKYYNICLPRHDTYVANTLLAAACAASEVIGPKVTSRAEMLKAVAQVITSLCPAKARCLLIPGFAEAQHLLGLAETENRHPAELSLLCGCARCQALKAKKELKKRAS